VHTLHRAITTTQPTDGDLLSKRTLPITQSVNVDELLIQMWLGYPPLCRIW
jgi:hypothetical protein